MHEDQRGDSCEFHDSRECLPRSQVPHVILVPPRDLTLGHLSIMNSNLQTFCVLHALPPVQEGSNYFPVTSDTIMIEMCAICDR